MKYLLPFFLIFTLYGCMRESNTKSSIKYSGYFIPVEGGRIEMHLDSITPLEKLIVDLKVNNKLYQTGKGYLIGFNDLMFSIAVHSNDAIAPLLNFIDTVKSINARRAALYTLYLVGINCTPNWPGGELFTNIGARDSIFKVLAENESLMGEIMHLLIRDPRESDVPKLFKILESKASDCWPITSGLLRYNLKNIPIKQAIPDSMYSMSIILTNNEDIPVNELMGDVFSKFANKYKSSIDVEDTLYHYDYKGILWVMDSVCTCFGSWRNSINDSIVYIRTLVNSNLTVTDGIIGSNYQYYYKNAKIYFCSSQTTKKLWLEWWHNQNIAYLDSLKNGYGRIRINRL